MKCQRKWHDDYGRENCPQCLVRDNGPWPENPWLKPLNGKTKLKKKKGSK